MKSILTISVVLFSLIACTKKKPAEVNVNAKAAEGFCFQQAMLWVSTKPLEGSAKHAFSESTDKIIESFTEEVGKANSGGGLTTEQKQELGKKSLVVMADFAKAEPTFMKECSGEALKVIKDCSAKNPTGDAKKGQECFKIHSPVFAQLKKKHTKL